MLRMHLRNPGLFLPQAKEILLAHQDLEDAGVRVNYHTGVMRAPGGQTITLDKRGAVWQVPLHTWKTDDLSGPSAGRKHHRGPLPGAKQLRRLAARRDPNPACRALELQPKDSPSPL